MASQRCVVFSHEEKVALVCEVAARRDVIEGELSSHLNHQMKDRAWASVAEQVSLVSGHTREADKLRKKFTTMKSDLKKKLARRKREENMTGGGPPLPPLEKDEEILSQFLPDDAISGVSNGCETATFAPGADDVVAISALTTLASGVDLNLPRLPSTPGN
ncbi:uncharacterized protein [Diadema antillarum]|uniref:uncharacterized protein n=1 Tax=Diadema antillarum TaxID=105358 RepID=UPI003A838CA1